MDTSHLGDRNQVYSETQATEELGLGTCQESLGLLELEWNLEPWTASLLA